VYDLERHPGPLEERLERIEALLTQLVPNAVASSSTGGQRISTSTYVDDGAMTGKANNGIYGDGHIQHPVPPTAHTTGVNDHDRHADGALVPTREKPHQDAHVPFVNGVAGAGEKEHIDAVRP